MKMIVFFILFVFVVGLFRGQTASALSPETISVTAKKQTAESAKIQKSGLSTESVSARQLKNKNAASLEDALSGTLGVASTGGPRSSLELPQVRGLEGQKVQFMLDGIRQNYRTKHNGALFFDPSLLKRVDVVKSSASTLYGSGAMGGAILFTTKDADDFLREGERGGGRVQGTYHSANEERGRGASLFGRYDKTSGLLNYIQRNAHNLRLGNGDRLPYSGYEDKDLLSKLRYQGTQHELRLSYGLYRSFRQAPLADINTLIVPTVESTALSDNDTKRESVSFRHNYEDWQWQIYRNRIYTTKTRLEDNRFDTRELTTHGLDVQNKWGNLLYGGELVQDKQKGTRNGEALSSYPGGKGQSEEAFAKYYFPLGNARYGETFAIIPSARFYHFHIESSNPAHAKRDESAFTKGMAFDVKPWQSFSLELSYNEGYNAPRIQNLYPDGYHFQFFMLNNFFVPNPDLRPERSRDYEAKGKWQGDDVLMQGDAPSLELSIYQKDVKDYIYDYIDIANEFTQYINLDFVRFRGLETKMSYDLPQGIGLDMSYSFVRARKRNGHWMGKAPADSLQASMRYTWEETIEIGFEVQKMFRHERQDPEEQEMVYPTAPVLLQNLYLSYSYQNQFNLLLRINNLRDKYYRKHAAYNYESGRDASLSLQWQL